MAHLWAKKWPTFGALHFYRAAFIDLRNPLIYNDFSKVGQKIGAPSSLAYL